jgi:serine/threonine-protein kinase RsbT
MAARASVAPRPEPAFFEQLVQALRSYLSEPNCRAAVTACAAAAKVEVMRLQPNHIDVIATAVARSLELFKVPGPRQSECLEKVRAAARDALSAARDEVTIDIHREEDLFHARAIVKGLGARVGLGDVGTTKVATALSELGRNILHYAGFGRITIRALSPPAQGVEVVATDVGPGIADLAKILGPNFRSRTGMGVGLRGTRNLMDYFDVQTAPGRGTTVTIRKVVAAGRRPVG